MNSNQNFVQVNESKYEVSSQANVGSLLDLKIKFIFFSEEPIIDEIGGSSFMDIDEQRTEIVPPEIFKKVFLSVAESTFSCKIMQNIAFLLINKLLSLQLKKAIGPATPE